METREKMNSKQKKILLELKQTASKLGHSPTKREIINLASKCYSYFGSFNRAKEKVGLKTHHKIILNFTTRAFKLDKELAAIASYLTFDGHIYKDLSGFSFYSKDIKNLKMMEGIIKRKFGILGKYRTNTLGNNTIHTFSIFNTKLAEWFYQLGVPKGEKVTQDFNVPKWIRNNKEFSREYLKIAFLCEGCNKENRKNPRIHINTAKILDIINSGIKFMNTIRKMLLYFNIKSTDCTVTGKRVRADGKISKDIRFRIITRDNNKFINEIGWIK